MARPDFKALVESAMWVRGSRFTSHDVEQISTGVRCRSKDKIIALLGGRMEAWEAAHPDPLRLRRRRDRDRRAGKTVQAFHRAMGI